MSSTTSHAASGHRLIAASRVDGTTVYNTAGEKLGHVSDIMIDKASGTAEYAVMSFGGFLGIGDKFHPLPWKLLTYDEHLGGYVVDLDKTSLEGAPAYGPADNWAWGDSAWGRRIDDYYGTEGYGMTDQKTGRRRLV